MEFSDMRIKPLVLAAPLILALGIVAEEADTVKPSVLTVKERVEILKVIAVASKKTADKSVEAELDDELKEILAEAERAEDSE